MKRRVEAELLDELPAADPRAVRSRGDLVRVNAWMGNAGIMVGALSQALAGRAPRRLVELGAGDGRFLLRVARRLAPIFPAVSVGLLDRQSIVSEETLAAFHRLGWRAEILKADVLDWLRWPSVESCDAIVANLFLHHFSAAQLAALLRWAARRTQVFVAIEPRRSGWSLAGSALLRLIGCNEVTRHDARVSVRAGFARRELSQVWLGDGDWLLQERPARWCSHLFVARRSAAMRLGQAA